MSKSKGNVIEPQKMIEKYSADALRYMSGGCSLGEDFPFQEKDLVTGVKFVNKFFNAAKFSAMHLEDYKPAAKLELGETFDKWLVSKLQRVIKTATDEFENFHYFKAKGAIEKIFWQSFCDQYLEIVKDRLYNPDTRGNEQRASAQAALYYALLNVTKLMAPITPHITEEVYQLFFTKHESDKSIHISSWPEYNPSLVSEKSERAGDLGIDVINTIRKYKSEQQMSLKEELAEVVIVSNKTDEIELLKKVEADLMAVLKAKKISYEGNTEQISEVFSLKIGVKK